METTLEKRTRLRPDAREHADTDWPAASPTIGTPTASMFPAETARAPIATVLIPGASPSVRYVYACLRLGVGTSTSELEACTGLPARTVRYAVRWLVDHGLCDRFQRLSDARRTRLKVRDEPVRFVAPPAIAAA